MIRPETTATLEKLEAWLKRRRARGRWLVLTHDNPDPDALATGMILTKVLRRRFRQQVTLAYGGIVGRAENREMVRTLKIKASRWRHLQIKNYRHVALVDCQPKTGNHSLPDTITPALVIDHHAMRPATAEVPLVDIRTDYSASASIAAEYLLASGLEATRAEATALVYAIRSETLDFSREAAGPDLPLYNHFLARANTRTLGRIQSPRLTESYFRTLHDALENLQRIDSVLISELGVVEQPDIVPEVADLLLRMEGVTWSLCTGQFEDRVFCSIRTTNPRANAASVMRRLLGRAGHGGGHPMIAGGWIGIPKDRSAVEVQAKLSQRFVKLLRKAPSRLSPLNFGGEAPKD
ncbi:MAG: DHHA1 domain-containing protein [Acidobacteriota bacterium]